VQAGEPAVEYSTYLKVPELLSLQHPRSSGPEHDELLFIVIHQSYELWFKSVLHELRAAQRAAESLDVHAALALFGRVRTILKVLVAKVDILETMTPLQFMSFRERLESASGFQSAQFREIEAVFGRRDRGSIAHLGPWGSRVEDAMRRRSVWDSALVYLHGRGHPVPDAVVGRDPSQAYVPSTEVEDAVVSAYRGDAEARLLMERLVDVDEGLQEWRYRHVKMVERTIGARHGTGGSSGRDYLASTLFRPVFPELWSARGRF